MDKRSFYARWVKRPLDFLCSLVVLLLFWWVYVILAALVRVKLGSPVLFRQERPGRNGKIFKLYKFRTMTDQRDENGELLPDEARLTKFGKLLRAASLDELPELFNILKGDMSLVGPRPLLVEYLPYYSDEENRRHEVRPGLTGLAQVNGRNLLNWADRFKLDVQYVDSISAVGDLKILFLTVKNVLIGSGVAENTRATEGNFAANRKMELEEKKCAAIGCDRQD